jgi:hypothetical protein
MSSQFASAPVSPFLRRRLHQTRPKQGPKAGHLRPLLSASAQGALDPLSSCAAAPLQAVSYRRFLRSASTLTDWGLWDLSQQQHCSGAVHHCRLYQPNLQHSAREQGGVPVTALGVPAGVYLDVRSQLSSSTPVNPSRLPGCTTLHAAVRHMLSLPLPPAQRCSLKRLPTSQG